MSSEVKIAKLKRRFIVKNVPIEDPNPHANLHEVLELLAHDHPALRHTQIFDSDARISSDGEYTEYLVVLPPVKTDG